MTAVSSPYAKAWPKDKKISPLSAAAGFGVSFLAGMADQYRRATPARKKEMKDRLTGMFSSEKPKDEAPKVAAAQEAPALPEVLDEGSLALKPKAAVSAKDSDTQQLDQAIGSQLADAAPETAIPLTDTLAESLAKADEATPEPDTSALEGGSALSDPQQFSAAFNGNLQVPEEPQQQAPVADNAMGLPPPDMIPGV